jgi:hypothetical protein
MASPEGPVRRRKAARKANGSGTIKKRKDGRCKGNPSHDKRELKRASFYGRR